jgi:hypothetical protein
MALTLSLVFSWPSRCVSLAGSKNKTTDFTTARAAMLSITRRESQLHVNALASPRFEGRETGKPGQWLAAKYLANEFANYRLLPSGDGRTYYQNFQLERTDLKHAKLRLEISKPVAGKMAFTLKSDFIPFNFTGENRLTVPVVFVGYGITAPEYNYDDYRNIDARGKIVLMLRHEPQENNPQSAFAGTELTNHALFEEKTRNAQAHGAVAMLLVSDPATGHDSLEPQGYWPSFSPGKIPQPWQLPKNMNDRFPAIWIDIKIAEAILAGTGKSLLDIQQSIDRSLQPMSFAVPYLRIHIDLALKKDLRQTQNVLALLKGADPDLNHEVVVVGAHYDHVGIRHDQIHPGADDNASGTAGLLEIAEALSELQGQVRRSVLFIAFSAEELGLLGSKFYVEHPVLPLDQTAAMINLDMIGRNADNEVTVIGSNRSPELHAWNLAANREIGLTCKYDGEHFFNRSDQANFAKHKIPVLFYNTAVHEDYHRPTDMPEKINAEKLTRIARLAFLVIWEIATADQRPTYRRFKISE